MESYQNFAEFYDELTLNIDYKHRAVYFKSLIEKYSSGKNTLLDLACGTGSLTLELHALGYDVMGADISVDMLSVAYEKSISKNILYINQSMEELLLVNKVDIIICALDSINHLENIEMVEKTFKNVSASLNDGGIFIFDVNTEFKQEKVLANNAFIYETDNVFCAWQNYYDEKLKKTEIYLDFFVNLDDNGYRRLQTEFVETVFSDLQLISVIEKSKLSLIGIFGEDTFESPKALEQRKVFVTRKE